MEFPVNGINDNDYDDDDDDDDNDDNDVPIRLVPGHSPAHRRPDRATLVTFHETFHRTLPVRPSILRQWVARRAPVEELPRPAGRRRHNPSERALHPTPAGCASGGLVAGDRVDGDGVFPELGGMLTQLTAMLRRARKLLRSMSFIDVSRLVFWTAVGRRSPLKVRIAGIALKIRPRTPDIRVAFSSLVDKEYGDIELEQVAVIIDGGANIGTSAIAFALQYPNATVIAIEPEAENFGILCENVRSWTNIKPLQAALAADNGERPLLNRGTGPWGYTITDSRQTVGDLGQTTTCLSIDTIIEQFHISSIDILKLDIEGGEKEVLEGSDRWIDKVRVFVAELHDRIVPGCNEAFNLATTAFPVKSKRGEKVFASR